MASRKIVFDTNVYVSAFLFGKMAKKAIDLAEEEKCQIFISLPILEELRGVLFNKKFKAPKEKIDKITKVILNKTLVVPIFFSLRNITPDPRDNAVIETGVEADVDYIVSGDKHLLKVKSYKDIEIIPPAKFIKILKETR